MTNYLINIKATQPMESKNVFFAKIIRMRFTKRTQTVEYRH